MADQALESLVERIKSAHASKTPLCLRGGGTKDFYGGALQKIIRCTRFFDTCA